MDLVRTLTGNTLFNKFIMNGLLILVILLCAVHTTVLAASIEPRSMTRIQEIFRYLGPQTNSRGKKLYNEPYMVRIEDQW